VGTVATYARLVAVSDLKRRALSSVALAGGALALAVPAGAQAAFPGANGLIGYSFSFQPGYIKPVPTTDIRSIDVVSPGGRGHQSLRSCTRVLDAGGAPLEPDRGDCSIEYLSPAWSPDGKRLAFDAGTRLAVMRSDGTDFRLLAQQTADDGEPAWSPDGRKLVFTGARGPEPDSGTDLYILDLGSGMLRRLTFGGGRDHSPAWSSRGRIAFTRGGEVVPPGSGNPFRPGSGNIYTVRPDGRGLRRLTYRNGSDPAWSPHASKLIFVRGQMVHAAFWRYGLFTVRADGSGLRRVNTPGAGLGAPGSLPDHPSWSPDGKLIGYHGSLSGVWVQRLDGRGRRQVATGGASNTIYFDAVEPDWQPRPR
jgi:Tol biopolymer transport system component